MLHFFGILGPRLGEAVEAAAVDAIHPLAETAVVGVAARPDVLGLRSHGGLAVGAVH